MKKFLNISLLLLGALSMGLMSCNHEEKDIFDESAAERLENSKDYFSNILVDQGGKWQLEYFTTTGEPGYIYLFTFEKNGTVTISGNNKYIGLLTDPNNKVPVYGSAQSMWEVITDDGPVLSFNTYNKNFHLFADPEDIPDTEVDEQGYGHNGDYEFDLMKYSNDTLYIEGKKHGVHMIMTRVPADVDDNTYLNEVVALKDSLFHAKIPTVYLNLPSGYRYVVSGGASLMLSFYPETGDAISETESYNAVVTHDGLTFMYPLQLMDSLTMTPYTVQTFKLAPDGSLVSRENPEISFTADILNRLVVDSKLQWTLNLKQSSEGGFIEKYNELSDQLKAANKNYSLVKVVMYFDKTLGEEINPVTHEHAGKFVLAPTIKVKVGTRPQPQNVVCKFYYDVEREGEDVIGFKYNGDMDSFASVNSKLYSKLLDLASYLGTVKYHISTASLLAPVTLKMSETSNESNYITVDVSRR